MCFPALILITHVSPQNPALKASGCLAGHHRNRNVKIYTGPKNWCCRNQLIPRCL